MTDKATLLREADEAFAELRRAVEGLTDEEMRRVWLGTWGLREILIHISGWHEAMTPALGRIAKGEAPYPVGTYDDFDAWNARFVQQKTGVKTTDVLAELNASHRSSSGPPEQCRSCISCRAALPGRPSKAPARDIIASTRPRSASGGNPRRAGNVLTRRQPPTPR